MKHILTIIILLSSMLFTTCTKELDLDEETLLLVDKQEKLDKLDALFDLSFKDALVAEENYREFVEYELLTETQNFLDDSDVSWRNSRTSLAIRMNANFTRVSSELPVSVFDIYKIKFETNVLNKTLVGLSPQQLRFDERYTRFKERAVEINTFFEDKVNELKESQATNETLINKNWVLSNKVVTGGAGGQPYVSVANFDFTLQAENGMHIHKFFFFPYIPQPNASFLSEQDEASYSILGFVSSDLLAPAEYVIYGSKLFFYFHLKSSMDPLSDDGKPEREWIFEYEYKVNNNSLVLSKPRMLLHMYPHLLKAEPGDEIYTNYYSDRMKEYTLTIH